MSPRRYLIETLLFAALGLGAVVCFNAIVDPWRLYQKQPIQGWTHMDANRTGAHDRLTKAHQIRSRQPQVLILGSSRVDWGIDEHHPALLPLGERRLNAGMAGATMYEMFRLTQHAVAVAPVTHIVVGLDIESFNQKKASPVFDESRLAVDATGHTQFLSAYRDLAPTLASIDATLASLRTLKASRTQPDLPWDEVVRRGSDHNETRPPEFYAKAYPHALNQIRRNLGSLRSQQPVIQRQLAWFDAFLNLAHTHDIAVHFYIHPYHASALQRIDETNTRSYFDAWKAELVRRNQNAARNAQHAPFPLCDFSEPSPVTTEPLPWPERPTTPMTYYFESSHFRKIVGDRILDRLFGKEQRFGVWLEKPAP